MPPSTKTQKRTLRAAKVLEADHPTVYSNFIGVGATQFDVSIVFGEITGTDGPNALATPRVKIVVAPEQAANLVRMLSATLENYVAHNGPLRNLGKIGPAVSRKELP